MKILKVNIPNSTVTAFHKIKYTIFPLLTSRSGCNREIATINSELQCILNNHCFEFLTLFSALKTLWFLKKCLCIFKHLFFIILCF